jgi:uncharacterized Fe-S center protein
MTDDVARALALQMADAPADAFISPEAVRSVARMVEEANGRHEMPARLPLRERSGPSEHQR